MSVQQLHPVEDQGVLPAVDAARASLRRVLDVPVASVGTDELTDALASVGVLESQAAALRMRLLAEADRREVATRLGATGTDAWAASLTGSTRAVVAGGLWLGRLLAERYAATRDALAEGAINEAQARVIVTAAEQLPEQVTREHRRAAEAGLVVKAVRGTDARRLRQAARRMLDTATAETARAEAARLRRLADEHEATMLEAEERRAETETWLTLGDRGDGTFVGRFVIPELHGHLLRAWLEQMTSPRRLAGGRDGEPVTDDTLDVSTGAQNLSWSERMGLGFTELLEHLPTSPDGKAGGFSRVGCRRAGAPRPPAPPRRAGLRGPRHGCAPLGRRSAQARLQRRDHPGRARDPVGAAGPRPREPAAHRRPASGPGGPPRHVRDRGL